MIPFFTTAPMHTALRARLLPFLEKFYDGNWYILGQELQDFETEYARFNEVRHCIGVANGLDALQIALRALDIGPGDEVIVPSNTYIASWLAVSNVGAIPVPVEPDPDTWNINPANIEAAITARTKAIMPVHLFGQACAMQTIMEIAEKNRLFVVEDNAQAHGARSGGRLTGSFGHINGTSFYPTKNLGALGDAGAITCNDDELADFAHTFRNYGSKTKYYNLMQGVNSRLDPLQAGVLRIKLEFLEQWNAEREALVSLYLEQLRDISDIRLPVVAENCTHVWHLFVVQCPQRDALQQHLTAADVQTMIHYPVPPHLQRAYADKGFQKGQFPLAEQLARDSLSLPLFPGMQPAEVEIVCRHIRQFYQ